MEEERSGKKGNGKRKKSVPKIIKNHIKNQPEGGTGASPANLPTLPEQFSMREFPVMAKYASILIRIEMEQALENALRRYRMQEYFVPGEDPRFLRPIQAAMLLNVTVETIKKYEDQKRLRSYTLPGGHQRYLRAEVLALVKKN